MDLQQPKERKEKKRKEIEDRVEMKGGRTKSEAAPTPTPTSPKQEDDNGVAEDEEDEEEEEEEEEGGEGEDKESEERPKLDDGFYEIEDVRKKRVRKGRLQYLIKWRGWPETANTWEPVQNLQSCADIIEAFEESLQASKSSRKRKRKYGGPHIQPKKKRSSGKFDGDSLLPPILERSTPANGSRPDNTADDKAEGEGNGGEHGNSGSKAEQFEQPTENGTAGGLQHVEKKTENQDNANRGELQRTGCTEENSGNISILFPDSRPSEEDVSTDGHSKIECMQLAQSSRFTGAKKRKSGSVRRFKQDMAAGDPEEAQNAAARSAIDSRDKCDLLGVEDVESVGDEAGDRNKLDDSTNPPFITKLIKPIGYSASVSNNVQDVSVTFMALRSDGKEVVVDNKFLKANNPLLLIGFYEQHLRYSPPV